MQHDVLDDDTTDLTFSMVKLSMLASLKAQIATHHGTHVCCLTEKAMATRDIVSSFVPQHPEEWKEDEFLHSTIVVKQLNMVDIYLNQQPTTLWLEKDNLGVDIWSELRGKYTEDPFFQVILEKPKEFRNFENKENLIYLKKTTNVSCASQKC